MTGRRNWSTFPGTQTHTDHITFSRIASLRQIHTLAPSPRVLAYLLSRGRIPPASMALTVIETPQVEPEIFKPPPEVVTTPCDPWPRPYYLEDGLRRVAPYHFTYNTNVKERWRGRGLLDIFRDEFRDRPTEYYVCLPTQSYLTVLQHPD